MLTHPLLVIHLYNSRLSKHLAESTLCSKKMSTHSGQYSCRGKTAQFLLAMCDEGLAYLNAPDAASATSAATSSWPSSHRPAATSSPSREARVAAAYSSGSWNSCYAESAAAGRPSRARAPGGDIIGFGRAGVHTLDPDTLMAFTQSFA